jgi:cell division protein FtsB
MAEYDVDDIMEEYKKENDELAQENIKLKTIIKTL